MQKTIDELIKLGDPPLLAADQPVSAAVDLMRDRHLACVLVGDADALVGIFTERDFLNRVAAPGLSPDTTQVSQVMTANPDTLQPGHRLPYAINLMAERGFRNVPIVDKNGRPVAVLSVRDVVEHLSEVFGEVDGVADDPAYDDWIDIGGG